MRKRKAILALPSAALLLLGLTACGEPIKRDSEIARDQCMRAHGNFTYDEDAWGEHYTCVMPR